MTPSDMTGMPTGKGSRAAHMRIADRHFLWACPRTVGFGVWGVRVRGTLPCFFGMHEAGKHILVGMRCSFSDMAADHTCSQTDTDLKAEPPTPEGHYNAPLTAAAVDCLSHSIVTSWKGRQCLEGSRVLGLRFLTGGT